MLRIRSLLSYAAIAVAMIGMTVLAPTALAQQAQPAEPCPLGEAPIPGADKTPPTLDTNWAPVNGTAVRPGDQIKVTMVARDDPDPLPTGIKTIQLVADSEGGRFIASENYEACSEPLERRVEATYTVPANPPPIVRLTALAEDHAGLMDTDVGEFPTSIDGEYQDTGVGEDTDVGESRTGDWYGTFTMVSSTVLAPVKSSAQADIVLRLDGKGNLTGTMIGQREVMAATVGDCSWRPIQPGRFRVSLVGSYTEGRSLKVFVENVVDETRLKYELRCSGISIPLPELGFKPSVWGYQAFLGTPSPLGDGEVLADGSRQYKLVTDMTTTWTVTLRPTP